MDTHSSQNSSKEVYIRLINKAEDYVEGHLKQPISLKDLAQHVHLSEFHFHRIFRQYSTETVHQFVQRIKLERSAIYLVVNPHRSITETALDYGFNDSSSYSRAFKKQFGSSPSVFRKARQQDLSSR